MASLKIVDDEFTRANTDVGIPRNISSVGNNWEDVYGRVFEIDTNRLKGTVDGKVNAYLRDYLLRPKTEICRDQKVIITTTTDTTANQIYNAILRYQEDGSCYLISMNFAASGVGRIFRLAAGGTITAVTGSVAFSAAFVAGRSYRITATCSGASSTTLTYLIEDITTAATVVTLQSTTDSSGPQVAGRMGLNINTNTSPYSEIHYVDNLECYNESALAQTTIDCNNSGLVWSPFNWYQNGSTYVQSSNLGAYMKTTFTGTSCYMVWDDDLMTTATLDPSTYIRLRVSIDDGEWREVQLPATGEDLCLAAELTDATHSMEIYIASVSSPGGDYWAPTNTVRITDFKLDTGEAFIAPTSRSNTVLVYGDSISGGAKNAGGVSGVNWNDITDAGVAWPYALGWALNAEFGVVSSPGMALSGAGAFGFVAFWTSGSDVNTAWNKHLPGVSRLSGGLLDPQPDYIFIALGVNDEALGYTDAAVNAAIEGALDDIRTAAPSAYIYVVIPFDGSKRTALTGGVNDYLVASNDMKTFVIDLGPNAELGLESAATSSGSRSSGDKLHPSRMWHGLVGAMIARNMPGVSRAGIWSAN